MENIALELEKKVLGVVISLNYEFDVIAEYFNPEHFGDEKNKLIAEIVKDKFENGKSFDIQQIIYALRKKDRDDLSIYAMQLTSNSYFTFRLEDYFLIIEEYKKRKMAIFAHELLMQTQDPTTDILDLEAVSFEKLVKLTASFGQNQFQKIDKLTSKYLDELGQKTDSEIEYKTGFTKLNELTGGFQTGLTVLGARPAMGKTALAIQLLINLALQDITVLFFSLEMPASQLIARIISNICLINSKDLRDGKITEAQFSDIISGTAEICQKNIYIYDSPEKLTNSVFRAKVSKLRNTHKDKFTVIVDYLQLMGGGKGNREQEIRTIAETLRLTGNALDIPVIALSQLSRSVEETADKRPTMRHLRESGAIEQEAHTILFLYRPEYYGLMEDENGDSNEGKAVLIVAKCRNGELGEIKMLFEGEYSKFTDLDKPETNDYSNSNSFQNQPNDFDRF